MAAVEGYANMDVENLVFRKGSFPLVPGLVSQPLHARVSLKLSTRPEHNSTNLPVIVQRSDLLAYTGTVNSNLSNTKSHDLP